MMSDVFISYVEEDGEIIQQIAADLEQAGFSTWYYQRDGIPGLNHFDQTRKVIKNCQAVLLILSKCTLHSRWVDKEVVYTDDIGKPIIPILLEISYEEFKGQKEYSWSYLIGSGKVAANLTKDNLHQIIPRLIAGLHGLGVTPRETGLIAKIADLDAHVLPSREEPPASPTRQRKLVTLLYLDVVSSTAMTQHLDPEDTLEIMDNALPRLAAPVESHGGHVTRYTGDGFNAVFGDPVAREDDPEQAIRAGLEILELSQSLTQELEKQWEIEGFQVRIGVNTGLVALGGYTEAEDTIMGLPVNLAALIESSAPPGGLLISHNTYRHVRGVFNVEPQEPITAKGFPESVIVYLVKDIKPRAFRLHTLGVEGVETRMIGRVTELDYLKDALLTANEEGEGQVVTITGEAGVGKSRLLYEFDNWIELLPQPEVRFFQGRSRQDSQGLPYSLLRDLFAFRFQILDDDTGEQARRKIETSFGEVFGVDGDGMMRAHIVGQLLGFDFSASTDLKGVINDPEQLRNRGLMYLKEYFQSLSQENPIVIFLEDIHWGDDSSLDAVNQLGEHTPQLRLLIVCAARPSLFERRPYWGEGQTNHTRLELHSLSKRESRQLVAEILKMAGEVPVELRDLVVSGAEGNPLYVEELIKMLIEDEVVIPGEETWHIETDNLAKVDVPPTLAGVLQARLDRLAPNERIVLQQASVAGRLFWDRLVAHIQVEGDDGGNPQLVPLALNSLRDRELVYRREETAFSGAVEYLFKHDLLREVTYESVLKRLRKIYHGLVADWLIANSGDRIGEYSGMIADHLELAGKKEQAVINLYQAGEYASKRYAHSEAIGYFTRAIAMTSIDDLVGSYDLLLARENVLDSQGDREAQKADLDALKGIVASLVDIGKQTEITLRYANYFLVVSNFSAASDAAREAIDLAEDLENKEAESLGNKYLGSALIKQDKYEEAKDILGKGLSLAKWIGRKDLFADMLVSLGNIDRSTGDFEKAQSNMEQALTIFHEDGNLSGECRTQNWLGNLASQQGNHLEAQVYFEKALFIARIIGDRLNEAVGLTNLGNISNNQGDFSSAKDYYEQALLITRAIGSREGKAALLGNLGFMTIHMGIYHEAQLFLRESQVIFRQIGTRIGECIALLNLGSVAHNQGEYLDAHNYYMQALDLAREIGSTANEGYALAGLGNALIGLGQLDIAEETLQKSISLRKEIDQIFLVMESQESLARVAMERSDITSAQRHINSILGFLDKGNTLDGTEAPFRIYLTCFQVLEANQNPRAPEILSEAYSLLQTRAGKISDENLRHSFLNNVAANRDIVREYESRNKVVE